MEIVISLPNNGLGVLKAQALGECGTALDESGLGVLNINPVRHIFEQGIEQVAFVGKFLLHLVTLGNIPKHDLDAGNISVRSKQRGLDHVDDDFAAVR